MASRQKHTIDNITVYIVKIISYNADTKHTYYYPRISTQDDSREIELDGIETGLDILITTLNHLIEVLVLEYKEFMEMVETYLWGGIDHKISLVDLIYRVFYEEYIHYVRPILQVVSSWLQVEAPFDKYYLIGSQGLFAYRIHPQCRLESFIVRDLNLQCLQLEKYFPDRSGSVIKENIFTPVTATVFNHLK